jgi:hypothetical protein
MRLRMWRRIRRIGCLRISVLLILMSSGEHTVVYIHYGFIRQFHIRNLPLAVSSILSSDLPVL